MDLVSTASPEACPGAAAELCRCPRQGDWWLCRARPDLEQTADGELCELGPFLHTTGSDSWPGTYNADGSLWTS